MGEDNLWVVDVERADVDKDGNFNKETVRFRQGLKSMSDLSPAQQATLKGMLYSENSSKPAPSVSIRARVAAFLSKFLGKASGAKALKTEPSAKQPAQV